MEKDPPKFANALVRLVFLWTDTDSRQRMRVILKEYSTSSPKHSGDHPKHTALVLTRTDGYESLVCHRQFLVNTFESLSQILGHGSSDRFRYTRQTIVEKVRALLPESLENIKQLVVEAEKRLSVKSYALP